MATAPVEVKKNATPLAAPDALWSLRGEMDRLFDRFAGGFAMPSLSRAFDMLPGARLGSSLTMPAPAVDISEDATAYTVTAELPGMVEGDVEVAVTGDTLTLKGEKKQETEKKDKNFFLSERTYGSFQRSFTLPDGVDRDAISAAFAKGVLTISLPKTPEAKLEPKKIEVKAAA